MFPEGIGVGFDGASELDTGLVADVAGGLGAGPGVGGLGADVAGLRAGVGADVAGLGTGVGTDVADGLGAGVGVGNGVGARVKSQAVAFVSRGPIGHWTDGGTHLWSPMHQSHPNVMQGRQNEAMQLAAAPPAITATMASMVRLSMAVGVRSNAARSSPKKSQVHLKNAQRRPAPLARSRSARN